MAKGLRWFVGGMDGFPEMGWLLWMERLSFGEEFKVVVVVLQLLPPPPPQPLPRKRWDWGDISSELQMLRIFPTNSPRTTFSRNATLAGEVWVEGDDTIEPRSDPNCDLWSMDRSQLRLRKQGCNNCWEDGVQLISDTDCRCPELAKKLSFSIDGAINRRNRKNTRNRRISKRARSEKKERKVGKN